MRVAGRWGMGLAGLALVFVAAAAGAAPRQLTVAATARPEVQGWDARIQQMVAAGDLRLRWFRDDTLVPGRHHERFAQLYKGVPVFGGELVRQSDSAGAVSVFGVFFEGLDLDARPILTADQALGILLKRGARPFGSKGKPQLMVLPREGAAAVLAYRIRAWAGADIRMYFLDARDGSIASEYGDLQTQAVGTGSGVLGDRKKMSVIQAGSTFRAEDALRPPPIRTYDYKGDLFRLFNTFDSVATLDDLPASDLASDSDNNWTDGADVDAHAYAGWVYDYYFKRFGRRGLDNGDLHMVSVVHPVNRDDLFDYDNNIIGSFFLNAFYAGDGLMVYGEGLPEGYVDNEGRRWNYTAGALDVVAHELTHGVTDFSSSLIYQGESGALNEAFSDIMGTSVEFFFHPPGNGSLQADYLLGEDVITPGIPGSPRGLRSMADPGAYGDPDNYSVRYRGSADNGGVHTNSGIANQAFFLAIEGGTNRTSGISVQGVGGSNRAQIEKVFYRGFALLLPPNANFSLARATTIQSARDLFGAGSPAESAVTQAWSAVGVD